MNSSEMIPGLQYIIDGHVWVKCGDCGKVVRMDGLFGGMHLCAGE